MSTAKHSYGSVTDGRTDRQTDGQTGDGQSDPYMSLCFAGDTKIAVMNINYTRYEISFYIVNSTKLTSHDLPQRSLWTGGTHTVRQTREYISMAKCIHVCILHC